MCGISGFNWEDKQALKKMADSIIHRGPDAVGYYTDEHVSITQRRLSIVDLSEKGTNPMPNEDEDVWIVFNGEVYNHPKLRPVLERKGHTYFSNTDTESIIHAYEEYGPACVKQLEGMFAFAIWDTRKKQLFLARDRLGIKPLYYYHKDGDFIFASEIKAILQHERVERKMSKEGFTQVALQSFPVDGKTMFENIYELLPGHFMIVDQGTVRIQKYWDLSVNITSENDAYYIDKVKDLLTASIKDRMMSDVPIGSALSGGIDCGTIVGILSTLSETPLNTFTTGFGDPLDEYKEAKIIADHCGTNHKEILLTYEKVTKKLPEILWHMEMPFARPSVFPTFFVGEEAKKHVTVVYCGEGGDEVFAGFNRYYAYAPKPTQTQDLHVDAKENYEKWENATQEDKLNHISWGTFKQPENYFHLTNQEKHEAKTIFKPFLENKPQEEHLNHALAFDLKYEIPGAQTWRVDRATMASSLEFRFPYLDHKLVEFSTSIPPILKMNGSRKKLVLQEVAKQFLPKEAAMRRKWPWGLPIMRFFKRDFMDFVDQILDDQSLAKRSYLKRDEVSKLKQKIKSLKLGDEQQDKQVKSIGKEIKDHDFRKLLFLTNLELWQRVFIENDKLSKQNLSTERFLNWN